jgi:hypothetical protein
MDRLKQLQEHRGSGRAAQLATSGVGVEKVDSSEN